MAAENSLKDLMIEEIRDLYSTEKQLTKALPKMAKGASSPQLKALIEGHLEETEGHVTRLEQIFEMLDEKPKAKHCAGMAGIIEEGSDLLQEDFDEAILDAGIIAGAQRAEHYEIAAYGSVMAWAKILGYRDVASLLGKTLDEEKTADEKLSALAEKSINRDAVTAVEDDENTDTEDANEDRPAPAVVAGARNGGRKSSTTQARR